MPVYQITITIPMSISGDNEKDAEEQAAYKMFERLQRSISMKEITAKVEGQTSFF